MHMLILSPFPTTRAFAVIQASGKRCLPRQGGVSAKEDVSLLAVIECLEKAADGHASSAGQPPEDERRNRRLSAWRERFTRAPSAELTLVQRAASADSRLSRVRSPDPTTRHDLTAYRHDTELLLICAELGDNAMAA